MPNHIDFMKAHKEKDQAKDLHKNMLYTSKPGIQDHINNMY